VIHATAQGMRNMGMAGSSGGAESAVRESTLAERLERANNHADNQIGRMLAFLQRINGTPPQPTAAGQEKIATTTPLALSVDRAEQLGKQLAELASSMERIG
jgi:hypothetical protein